MRALKTIIIAFITVLLLSSCQKTNNSTPVTTPDTTEPISIGTEIKDRNEWMKIFSSESYKNVTFEIESILEEGSFYSKIMLDGDKAKAAEKIESAELFDKKAKYYRIEENTYKLWDPETSTWKDSYDSEECGREMVIGAVYDDNVLLYARDYYDNYVYDTEKQAYVWTQQNGSFEFFIKDGKCVKMVFTLGDLSIVTNLTDYGNTVVTYPENVK